MTNKPIDIEAFTRAVEIATTKGYVTQQRAALLLGFHPYTVRDYVRKGWIQTIDVGRLQMITLREIERFKTEGNYQPSDTPPPAPDDPYE